MIVKKQKPIEFINQCNCQVNYKELEQAIKWFSKKPTARLKTIYLYGKYPAVSIYEQKIHIHRLLMMYWTKRDLDKREYVHHLDGNRLNATKNNLITISDAKHTSKHHKGKKLSKATKAKISLAGRKRKGIKIKKRYDIPVEQLKKMLNQGMSINAIAKHYGCDWSTIKSRIFSSPELLEEKK